MITHATKIGYISSYKNSETGKETYEFIEAKTKRINVGKRITSIHTDKFRALDIEEIESNTDLILNCEIMLVNEPFIMLVNEPFITNDEYSEHCRKTVECWNKHGAK